MDIVKFKLPEDWREKQDIVLQVWIAQIQGFKPYYTGGDWLISKESGIPIPDIDRALAIAWLEAWQRLIGVSI